MRAIFLTQWFDPEPGAIRGLPLAKWMTGKGHEIKVLTGVPNYPGGKIYDGYQMRPWQRESIEGVPILRVPLYPSHDGSALGRIANYGSFALSAATLGTALIGKAQVGYVYHPPATVGFPAMILQALRRLPFVYHIADMWPESVTESGMLGEGKAKQFAEMFLSSWCNLVYRSAKAITVLSPGFKRLLIERGVAPEKIHIIYNWTDEETFKPMSRDEQLLAELGLENSFNIVYAGNLGAFQGIETIIKAAAQVKHLPQIRVVIIGTGQKEEELKKLARETGSDNVVFLGRRQYWEMPSMYSIADVLLIHLKDLPFFAATVPSKTQVSLSCGRPILMGVRGDSADIVNRAEAGISVEPENEFEMAKAMETFFRMSKDEREAMGRRGRDFYLSEMSLNTGGAAMENLFREVAQR